MTDRLTEAERHDCLMYNPFEGDFGEQGDFTFSDRIGIARKHGPCNTCRSDIRPGEQQRRLSALIGGEACNYRWCFLCCKAMAESWTDDGESIEARYALGGLQ